MNILQIVSKLDTSDNARDSVASTRFLTLNGHKVVVASEGGKPIKEIDNVGARHYVIPLRPNIFLIPLSVFKLSQIIRKENIHIVHARDAFSSVVGFFASRLRDTAFVATVYEPYVKGLFTKAQFWAKCVICFSESEAHYLIKKGLVLQKKLYVIPPFIKEASKASHGGGHFAIGAALPLSFSEVMQNFIKSISILSRTIHRIKVFVIDKSPHREKDTQENLKLLIKRHSLNNIVIPLAKADEEKILSELDLFVQIKENEAASARILLQAQARGIPALTSISSRDVGIQGLASRIRELYRNEKLREEIANEGKNSARKNFNIKKIMKSTVDVYENAISTTNILIIKIGALGDVILAVPSIRALRKKFPKSKIKVLVGLDNREVFMNAPFIDEVMVCDFKERDKGLKGLLRVAKRLRAEDFDRVIDLQNNKRSHVLSFLSCAPKRYGYDNGKLSFLLNRKAKGAKLPLDPITHQLKVLNLLRIYNIDRTMELWPTKEDEKWADNFLTSNWVKNKGKLVAFNIGSGVKWATKLWPIEHFAGVCNRLAKDFGIRVVLIGSEKTDSRIEDFLNQTKCKPINALGKTNIPRLASLVKRCNLLLSPDSAPIHVAAAVDTPFIALFGPTDPDRHMPPAKKCTVIKKDLPCAPCYQRRCDRGYICMQSIEPDEVYKVVLKLLDIKK